MSDQPIPQTGPERAPIPTAEELVLRIPYPYPEEYATVEVRDPSGAIIATILVVDETWESFVPLEQDKYRRMRKEDVLAEIKNPIDKALVQRAIAVAEQFFEEVYYRIGTLKLEVYRGDFEKPIGEATVKVLRIESQVIEYGASGEAARIANILRKRITARHHWLAKYVTACEHTRYKADVAIVLPISVGELEALLRRV